MSWNRTDDLISRQAALDALNGEFAVTGRKNAETIRDYINGVDKRLRELPSAERWIPVTERLPEEYDYVLLSVRQGYAIGESDNWCVVGYLVDKPNKTWLTHYGFHEFLGSDGKKATVWISAWMPLPEPYKGWSVE